MVSENQPGDNRAYQIQLPCILFFVLTSAFVAVRIWARLKLRGWSGFGWDDGTIVASWVFATTVSALMMASCAYGFGQHVANLSRQNKSMALKLFYVAQIFYKLTINLSKASILLLYLRIFVTRQFRIACWTLLATVLAYMVATTVASIRQCSPVPRAWDKTISGECISMTDFWYANAGFSIATDILILALPMYPIYSSHLPPGQKVALMVVFALGLFTTVTSILRMQTLSFSTTSPDITWDIDSSIWTMIEENLAIICACLPVCRLPLSYIFPTHFSASSSSSSFSNPAARKHNSSTDIDGSWSSSKAPGSRNSSHGPIKPSQQPTWPLQSSARQHGAAGTQLENDIVEIPPAQAAGWPSDEEGLTVRQPPRIAAPRHSAAAYRGRRRSVGDLELDLEDGGPDAVVRQAMRFYSVRDNRR
ncbi:integral membrane protein [Lasiosphaeria ovina]|uniref:Integral membrane protein n=1 Tax=Lasiosphaeria ovina TaxID=92902 RepID=A0AAE0NIF2_9PEZI|nr:integral membrane protein [Lasiosphaeria ovina]